MIMQNADSVRDLSVLGEHIASEAVRRIIAGQALGTPSLHNIIREAAIDVIEAQNDSSEGSTNG